MNRIFLATLFLLFTAANLTAAPASTQPTTFIRYVEFPDGSGQLQVAEASYKNDAGVAVHLIGAVHIADEDFFAGLDESFEHYDALLYEMVKPRGVNLKKPAATQRAPSLAWVGDVQKFLRDHLDLVYQLDGIDYSRANFVHADLDAQSFLKMQEDRGESMFTLMLQSAIHNMSKAAAKGPDMSGLQLLAALFSPDQSRELKRVLAQQFANVDDAMEGMEGPNGSVIIGERNKVALRVLDEQIDAGKKYLGIFYGAGHLKLMEKTLVEEKGFHKVGVTWRTAWEIGPPAPAVFPATRKS